jgi:hypothetical protein
LHLGIGPGYLLHLEEPRLTNFSSLIIEVMHRVIGGIEKKA